MGIETGTALVIASIVSTLVSVSASVYGGVTAAQAYDKEAELLEEQGALALLEANEEADRIDRENIKFEKRQKLAFLKSGVSLEGSPLLILEETRTDGAREVAAIRRRGAAQLSLAQGQAGIARATGRARLIGGIAQGAGSLAQGFGSMATFGSTRLTSEGIGQTQTAQNQFATNYYGTP